MSADDRGESRPLPGDLTDVRYHDRPAYLYGLIITGSVLVAAPADIGLVRVVGLVIGTLAVYWLAETYAHWIVARTRKGRGLYAHERREILASGVPLFAACALPGVVLLAEGLLGIEPTTAVRIALIVNIALLLLLGWRMSTAGGLSGWRRLVSTALAGLLGVAMIVLKLSVHH